MSVELVYASISAEQPALTGLELPDRTLHLVDNTDSPDEAFFFGYGNYSYEKQQGDYHARVAITDTLYPYVTDDIAFRSLSKIILPKKDEHTDEATPTLTSIQALAERLQASVPEIDRYRLRNQLAAMVVEGTIDPLHHTQTTDLLGFNDTNRWPHMHKHKR